MRNSVYALVLGTTLISCKAKQSERAVSQEAVEAPAARIAKAADEGRGGDIPRAEPAEPPAPGAAAGSAAVVMGGGGSGVGYGSEPPAGAAKPRATAATGNVRAGEWDDNANYRDYIAWLGQTSGIARLDVAERQFLVVKDRDGKPMPNCTVKVSDGTRSASLVTMASGRALLFPKAYGLTGTAFTVDAQCQQAQASTQLASKLDGIAELVLDTTRALPQRRAVDLAFVLDTTGSMSEEIEAVKSTIRTVADKLASNQTDVRIGLVEYKDRGDQPLTKTYPFSSNLAAFSQSVAGIAAGGGGDLPEDMQAGLTVAIDQLTWRKEAVARMVVVIADAPPHLDYQDERDYAETARRAASRGIKLYTVSASGMDETGQIVMRQMAQFTGASNLFVLRGGAGPQSVGGGDPASSCGGTQGQYASGNLDQLIVERVRRELASLEADPTRIAGRLKDENSKPCDQRLVMAN